MTPPLDDDTRITRYLLGECTEHEETAIRNELEQDHAAAAEARKVELAISALREGAVVPNLKLTPEQRRNILQPAAPARVLLTAPSSRPLPARKAPPIWLDTFYSVARAAAVVALAVGAFLLGQRVQTSPSRAQIAAAVPPSANADPAPPSTSDAEQQTIPTMEPPKGETPKPTTPVRVAEAESEAPKPSVMDAPAPEAPASNPPLVTAAPGNQPAVPATKAKPAQAAPILRGRTVSPQRYAFANASRDPKSQFILHPAEIQPAPVKSKESAFAKPLEPGQKVKPATPAAKRVKPPVYIHSWRSEVAACPWNPEHRLMRIIIQLPANQPAAQSKDHAYPLQVEFDAHHVRDYRLLCERHVPAPDLERAGTHILWYEFSPNGAPAKFASVTDKPVATFSLPGVRFTTKTVGPFDESRLIVEDPGLPWTKVRDDFAFESAVVGFGLLLHGAGQTGSLNHDLVLTLAREARGESPHAERDRFIKLVEDAQKAVGL